MTSCREKGSCLSWREEIDEQSAALTKWRQWYPRRRSFPPELIAGLWSESPLVRMRAADDASGQEGARIERTKRDQAVSCVQEPVGLRYLLRVFVSGFLV
jgi:hypothetical protein